MKAYRLSKKYILKMMIERGIILLAVDGILLGINIILGTKFQGIFTFLMYFFSISIGIITFITPVIEFLAYKYIIYDESIELIYGVLFRKTIYIPRGNIKYLIAQKGPIDNILRIRSLKLYTTAGSVKIRALNNDKIKILWRIMDVETKED
ncbi:MAG: PH domain-containing protein [Sarcina sp.]